MSKTKVIVQTVRSSALRAEPDADAVGVSAALLRKWGIASQQFVNLRFGAYRSRVRVVPLRKAGRMRIGERLADAMGLFGSVPLRASYRKSSETLAVGPLIGVMMPRDVPHEPDRPFENMTAFCRELVEAAKEQGAYVYFFPPSGVEPGASSLRGWTYAEGWKQGTFPIPDVLHNRLTSRKLENQANIQQLMKDSKTRYGTHVFNEKYLDKTEVFAALRQEPELQTYLPESHPFRGYDTLKSMAAKYQTLFLKPVRGSLGRGIIRIARTDAGTYECYFSEPAGSRRAEYASLAKVYAIVSHRMRKQRFQIQQGLQIAAVRGRPVDFRALVQKGLSGEWGVTSIVGRIAGANQFVSNLAKGGAIATLQDAILRSDVAPGRRTFAAAQLRKAAVDIAKGVERTIDAHFGELGVDLAVDKSGRVWLLEVNSKPSKQDSTQLKEGKRRPSVAKLVSYARFLAKL